MHPYSEYLHDYMIKNFGYSDKGKIKNDFRLTEWSGFIRKYWIDEIPQLINFLERIRFNWTQTCKRKVFSRLTFRSEKIKT